MMRTRLTIWILSTTILAFFIWAYVAPLDIASHAPAEVIPEGQLKRIQHLEGGIVEKIFVKEGEKVEANQPLYELSPTASDATMAEIAVKAASIGFSILRLRAQLKRAQTFEVDPAMIRQWPSQHQSALAVFQAEKQRFLSEKQVHELRVEQKAQEEQETQARLNGMQKRMELIQKQVQISERLLNEQLVNDFDHLNLLKEEGQIEAEIQTLNSQLSRTKTALNEAKTALKSLEFKHEESLQKDLAEALIEQSSLDERMRKVSDSRERTIVRAPVKGTVLSLFYVTSGGVVPPGGTLLTLVPNTQSLILNARLHIGDVGFVHPGQKVRLSLMSTSMSGISPIDGTVLHISPDALTDPKTGPYYLVQIAPTQDYFGTEANPYPLKPGLQVMASILIGQRTILGYFLEPLLGDLIYALNEP